MDGSVSLGTKAIDVESIWTLHRELRGVFFVCMDFCIFKLCRMNLLCLLFGIVMNGGRKIRCGRANVVRFLKNKRIKTPKQTTMWSKIFKEFLKICYERDVRGYNSLGTITKNLCLPWGGIYESCLLELLLSVERYLRGNNYGLSVPNNKEFQEVQVFCNFVLSSAFVLGNSSICI